MNAHVTVEPSLQPQPGLLISHVLLSSRAEVVEALLSPRINEYKTISLVLTIGTRRVDNHC